MGAEGFDGEVKPHGGPAPDRQFDSAAPPPSKEGEGMLTDSEIRAIVDSFGGNGTYRVTAIDRAIAKAAYIKGYAIAKLKGQEEAQLLIHYQGFPQPHVDYFWSKTSFRAKGAVQIEAGTG